MEIVLSSSITVNKFLRTKSHVFRVKIFSQKATEATPFTRTKLEIYLDLGGSRSTLNIASYDIDMTAKEVANVKNKEKPKRKYYLKRACQFKIEMEEVTPLAPLSIMSIKPC